MNSFHFLVCAIAVIYPLEGLLCGMLTILNGKRIAIAVRHEHRYVCACGHLQALALCPGHRFCMNQ